MEKFQDFAQILDCVGSKGKYQKFLLYVVAVPIAILVPILNLSPIFIYQVPEHWCFSKEAENYSGAELEQWKNRTLPIETGLDGLKEYSQCKMYNYTDRDHRTIIDCPNGWAFDRSDLSETMASEFKWVCSRAHYSTTIFTVVQAGSVVGTIVFGLLTDSMGRKPAFFLSLTFFAFPRLVSFFIPEYFVPMAICTFLSFMGYPMVNLIPQMLVAEISDDEFRSWAYTVLFSVYVVGAGALPYIAYFCSHWLSIGMATTLPTFLIFFFWFITPESPSWLTSVGRMKEATEILKQISTVNKSSRRMSDKEIEKALEDISNSHTGKGEKPSIRKLVGTSVLAKRMMLIIICWCTNSLVYETITLNTPNLGGDQFFNFFALAIIEAPSSLFGGYLLSHIGRRWTATMFLMLSSIACFIGAAFATQVHLGAIVLASTFIAKFAINISTLVMNLQVVEVLPTPLRGTGTSLGSTTSSALAVLVPTIVYTGELHASAPYVTMGLVSIFATVASAFLPETMHQDLPETIEAANEFQKDIPFWRFRVGKKAKLKSMKQCPEINNHY